MTSRKSEKVVSEAIHVQIPVPVPVGDDFDFELNDNEDDEKKKQGDKQKQQTIAVAASESSPSSSLCSVPTVDGKKIVGFIIFGTICLLLWDALMRPPEERFLKPDNVAEFLKWVEVNPYWGIGAFLIVIAVCVILLLPIGTPLTMGCGFIYKGVYGWYMGVAVATTVSMAGSALGAVGCFLLGRYMMRDRVRKWVRKYPIFDAIDMGKLFLLCLGVQFGCVLQAASCNIILCCVVLCCYVCCVVCNGSKWFHSHVFATAVSEHGLRIMAMLYLTPVLPLGPVSYMCGSTSMPLSSFVFAKIASLPLMMLYVYIGAAAGTLIADSQAIEHNSTLIISGIGLSTVMISCISNYIRKELMLILDRQKSGGKKVDEPNDVELGTAQATTSHNEALQRRHVANDTMEQDTPLKAK